jgi:hypothetical protein
VGAIDAQFVGQMQGWGALCNTAQDLHNCGTAIAGLGEECAAEKVEDGTALAATIVRNDWPPSAVGRLIGGEGMTTRTAQAVWVQSVQQEVITRLFIKQSIKRKSEHGLTSLATVVSRARAARGRPPFSFTIQPT